jgi:hypothetical protein
MCSLQGCDPVSTGNRTRPFLTTHPTPLPPTVARMLGCTNVLLHRYALVGVEKICNSLNELINWFQRNQINEDGEMLRDPCGQELNEHGEEECVVIRFLNNGGCGDAVGGDAVGVCVWGGSNSGRSVVFRVFLYPISLVSLLVACCRINLLSLTLTCFSYASSLPPLFASVELGMGDAENTSHCQTLCAPGATSKSSTAQLKSPSPSPVAVEEAVEEVVHRHLSHEL